jgi:phosphotransferase system enzyme I (PtsI)
MTDSIDLTGATTPPSAPEAGSGDATRVVYGTPVVPGVAWAPAAWTRRPPLPPETAPELPEDQREQGVADFERAAAEVADGLNARAEAATGHVAEVLAVTASLATDRAWKREAAGRIRRGTPPVQATMAATEKFVELFQKAGGLMEERTTDLRDVRDRVIAHLTGEPEPGIPVTGHPVVLLADDLSPADTAGLDPVNYVAIATQVGGPTSHTSIIARQLGIPCIVAARELAEIPEGAPVLVNAHEGSLTLGVDEAAARALVADDADRVARIRAWRGPGRTADGVSMQLLANVQDGAGAVAAAGGQAEGIGLFRTELLFLNTQVEPSVDSQAGSYAPVFAAFPSQKVVVRTLDAGSDKPVPFATLSEEFNPALGVRGIRTTGQNPDLLVHQLDAVAQAAALQPGTDVWVMAPMISTIPEARWFAGLVRERGLRVGIMIEVPAAAILIDQFLAEVDFVSIGTNDLTQYTMAADRMSPHLAEYTDPWQPAVLSLIARTAEGGMEAGKPVGVCGEAAADPLLACVLTGMGITSLSMAASAIPAVGAQLARVTMEQCRAAAAAVVGAEDAGDARNRARSALETVPEEAPRQD